MNKGFSVFPSNQSFSSNIFPIEIQKINSNQNLNSKPNLSIPSTNQVSQAQNYIKTTINKQKVKKNSNDSDVDSSDIENYRQKVVNRVLNYEEDEKKYEILGAHQKDGQLKFAVMHKKEGKIFWHSHESMRTEHLGMLLHFYESHIVVSDIVDI